MRISVSVVFFSMGSVRCVSGRAVALGFCLLLPYGEELVFHYFFCVMVPFHLLKLINFAMRRAVVFVIVSDWKIKKT